MGDTVMIRVDASMVSALEDLRKKIAEEIKNIYSLEEITIHGTLASHVMACSYLNKSKIQFKIVKNGLNKGTLEFL